MASLPTHEQRPHNSFLHCSHSTVPQKTHKIINFCCQNSVCYTLFEYLRCVNITAWKSITDFPALALIIVCQCQHWREREKLSLRNWIKAYRCHFTPPPPKKNKTLADSMKHKKATRRGKPSSKTRNFCTQTKWITVFSDPIESHCFTHEILILHKGPKFLKINT